MRTKKRAPYIRDLLSCDARRKEAWSLNSKRTTHYARTTQREQSKNNYGSSITRLRGMKIKSANQRGAPCSHLKQNQITQGIETNASFLLCCTAGLQKWFIRTPSKGNVKGTFHRIY